MEYKPIQKTSNPYREEEIMRKISYHTGIEGTVSKDLIDVKGYAKINGTQHEATLLYDKRDVGFAAQATVKTGTWMHTDATLAAGRNSLTLSGEVYGRRVSARVNKSADSVSGSFRIDGIPQPIEFQIGRNYGYVTLAGELVGELNIAGASMYGKVLGHAFSGVFSEDGSSLDLVIEGPAVSIDASANGATREVEVKGTINGKAIDIRPEGNMLRVDMDGQVSYIPTAA